MQLFLTQAGDGQRYCSSSATLKLSWEVEDVDVKEELRGVLDVVRQVLGRKHGGSVGAQ